jgi:hypothetical protein
MTPEDLARLFHTTYERLAPSFGYETRRESAKPWDEVPDQNRRLMIAVCAEVLTATRAGADAAGLVAEARRGAGHMRSLPSPLYEQVAPIAATLDRLAAAVEALTRDLAKTERLYRLSIQYGNQKREQCDAAEARVEALTAERDAARADVVAAAGELRVPMPRSGTEAARLLAANLIMRGERDAARTRLAEVERERDEARVLLVDADGHFQAWRDEAEARESVLAARCERLEGALRDAAGYALGGGEHARTKAAEWSALAADEAPARACLCGKYLGDNDGTCPQLTCIRERGHSGDCDNVSPARARDGEEGGR